jgi:hypothetical protein
LNIFVQDCENEQVICAAVEYHLYYFIGLVFVRKPREKPLSMWRRTRDKLRENAARAPNVHRFVVLPLAQQHLGRSVPARHNVLREKMVALAPREAKVANMDIAVLTH